VSPPARHVFDGWVPPEVRAAIEAEAIAVERRRLAEAVRGLPRDRGDAEWDTVARDLVLAAIESPT